MDMTIPSQFDNLLRDLREGAPAQRQQAAKALRDYGAAAVEPLCLALRDEDLNVRVAAVESLGNIGDERAVQPLIEALKACLIGRSGWRQLIIGVMLPSFVPFVFLGLVGFICWRINDAPSTPYALSAVWTLIFSLGIHGTCRFLQTYSERRSILSRICHFIIWALGCIAERTPAPELRQVLPDLKAISVDVFHHGRTVRVASREAVQRIEALTEQIKSLPLPASAPAPNVETLPRVGEE